ncbi:MAG TPA: hypothetical protein VGG45_19065 [Terracidiphilus sp.]
MSKTLKTVSALAIAAATLTAVTLANGSAASAHPLNGAHRLPFFRMHQPVFSCLACNLPRPHPTWGNHPWRFHNWGYGYNRWYWDRYRYRYGFVPHPGAVSFAAPAAVSAPAQASAGPQNCLTEQKMPDGSVMFADVCKQVSAIAPPPSADPRQ